MNIETDEIERVYRNAECLYSQQQVEEALESMAADIEQAIGESNPLIVCVMTGGMVAASELFMRMPFPAQLDYLHATRYQGTSGGTELKWIAPPVQPLQGRTVLVIDDILDEGLTLAAILEYCQQQQAAAVFSAVLVEKLHQRKAPGLQADFVGLHVDDRYVFGYGMDYHGYLRNARGIYAVTKT